jgi:hypothetical protein
MTAKFPAPLDRALHSFTASKEGVNLRIGISLVTPKGFFAWLMPSDDAQEIDRSKALRHCWLEPKFQLQGEYVALNCQDGLSSFARKVALVEDNNPSP